MSEGDSDAARGLDGFRIYHKANELFDLVVDDCAGLKKHPECYRLIGQQVASADSIAANIEEGYGRNSPREYARLLVISRGSAQETRGRYTRLKHWMEMGVIEDRVRRCDELIAGLTRSIKRLRSAG